MKLPNPNLSPELNIQAKKSIKPIEEIGEHLVNKEPDLLDNT